MADARLVVVILHPPNLAGFPSFLFAAHKHWTVVEFSSKAFQILVLKSFIKCQECAKFVAFMGLIFLASIFVLPQDAFVVPQMLSFFFLEPAISSGNHGCVAARLPPLYY